MSSIEFMNCKTSEKGIELPVSIPRTKDEMKNCTQIHLDRLMFICRAIMEKLIRGGEYDDSIITVDHSTMVLPAPGLPITLYFAFKIKSNGIEYVTSYFNEVYLERYYPFLLSLVQQIYGVETLATLRNFSNHFSHPQE
jgi:hypothetical protein